MVIFNPVMGLSPADRFILLHYKYILESQWGKVILKLWRLLPTVNCDVPLLLFTEGKTNLNLSVTEGESWSKCSSLCPYRKSDIKTHPRFPQVSSLCSLHTWLSSFYFSSKYWHFLNQCGQMIDVFVECQNSLNFFLNREPINLPSKQNHSNHHIENELIYFQSCVVTWTLNINNGPTL